MMSDNREFEGQKKFSSAQLLLSADMVTLRAKLLVLALVVDNERVADLNVRDGQPIMGRLRHGEHA